MLSLTVCLVYSFQTQDSRRRQNVYHHHQRVWFYVLLFQSFFYAILRSSTLKTPVLEWERRLFRFLCRIWNCKSLNPVMYFFAFADCFPVCFCTIFLTFFCYLATWVKGELTRLLRHEILLSYEHLGLRSDSRLIVINYFKSKHGVKGTGY